MIRRWPIYVSTEAVIIPTCGMIDIGYFMDVEPVSVFDIEDRNAILSKIVSMMREGNLSIPRPPGRELSPKPVVLKYAKVKSWAALERTALCWNIRVIDTEIQIRPVRRNYKGKWEEDVASVESYSLDTAFENIASRVVELIANSQRFPAPNHE